MRTSLFLTVAVLLLTACSGGAPEPTDVSPTDVSRFFSEEEARAMLEHEVRRICVVASKNDTRRALNSLAHLEALPRADHWEFVKEGGSYARVFPSGAIAGPVITNIVLYQCKPE